MYLSKLAAQMVTSTAPKNVVGKPYEIQNENFDFCSSQTLILYNRSIFFKGGSPKKIWSKNLFFMKTLSKLGALLVHILVEIKYDECISHSAGAYTATLYVMVNVVKESGRAPVILTSLG
jgi:hypothetical protein